MIAALLRAALAAAGMAIAAVAPAQERPLRIVVGFPPGGGSDLIARLAAEHLRASIGTSVVVENRPGVNGVVAAEALKNAAPDGRTLMVAPFAVTIFAPLTNARLRYDPLRDFAPVSLAASFQFALAVGSASPIKTMPEYVQWVRANPAKATFGTPTLGGPPHFFALMLARATGLDLAAVPYKGGAPLLTDLMGGQVPAAITALPDVMAQHASGKVRILATSGTRRSALTPDVPTFLEAGFADIEGSGWQAFYTTAGTPQVEVDRLSAAIAAAMNAPAARERLLALGLEPVGSTPEELARRMAQDTARWAPVVKASGFRTDGP